MEYKTFIDESGHTGDALLNNEQIQLRLIIW